VSVHVVNGSPAQVPHLLLPLFPLLQFTSGHRPRSISPSTKTRAGENPRDGIQLLLVVATGFVHAFDNSLAPAARNNLKSDRLRARLAHVCGGIP
jgi:hypothetical protein